TAGELGWAGVYSIGVRAVSRLSILELPMQGEKAERQRQRGQSLLVNPWQAGLMLQFLDAAIANGRRD
ncbi:MAG: hypothetical protein AAF283_14350, partial [Cyanobacteria bacterium P01_A01_bin.70]